jgi:drug/metabolite transporter (DMT)-like permease
MQVQPKTDFSSKLVGYLYLALAMMLVGSSVIASKIVAQALPLFTATALRFAMALPCFLLLMRITGTSWPRLKGRDWLLLLAQAGAGSVGYTALLITGLRLSAAADAGVIIGTLPVVAAVVSILVLGERPQRRLVLAIALASMGVLAIALGKGVTASHAWAGNLLIFGAVVCEGLFILLNKKLKTPIAPLAMSTLMTGMGLALVALPALLEAAWTQPMPQPALLAVAYYALLPTVAGYLLWYAGAEKVSGAEASLFTAVAPLSAVFFAAVLLHEPVHFHHLLGVACVLAAMLLLVVKVPAFLRPAIPGQAQES